MRGGPDPSNPRAGHRGFGVCSAAKGPRAMRESGPPSTTITLAGRPGASASTPGLALLWLYPRPTGTGGSVNLSEGDEWTIGRDEGCSVRVSGVDISRGHARLLRESGELFLKDLGSRNGTFVNGEKISSVRVTAGDVLRFGATVGLLTTTPGEFGEIAPGLWGGPVLKEALSEAITVAPSDLPVIVQGETGTGKEVVARALHAQSGRTGPFVAVNCAALPEALAEGELFGYRKGAFTGAERASLGVFRSAQGGTLLLDEVSDLPPVIQAKLLRVLEQREVQPLGEAQPVAIDVRVIVASQEPLAAAAKRGQFRPDLYARLNGITVELPPLRRRIADVPPLFSRLLAQYSAARVPALQGELVERLCLHDWPFNVRELVLLAKRILVLYQEEDTFSASHLPATMQKGTAAIDAAPEGPVEAGDNDGNAVDLGTLMAALRVSQGNVAQAAATLGISRQRAYRLMRSESVDLAQVRADYEAEP